MLIFLFIKLQVSHNCLRAQEYSVICVCVLCLGHPLIGIQIMLSYTQGQQPVCVNSGKDGDQSHYMYNHFKQKLQIKFQNYKSKESRDSHLSLPKYFLIYSHYHRFPLNSYHSKTYFKYFDFSPNLSIAHFSDKYKIV